MTMNRMIASLRRALRRFGAAREGNTAITFALALLPLVALIGAAVDYTRASSIRTALQAAADITALKLAQDASTNNNLSGDANTYFLAVFQNKGGAQSPNATATYSTTNGGTVVVTATATYQPMFMGVMNMIKSGTRVTSINLSVNATSNWSTARLRVALVLDNTGSMSQGSPISKLTALQDALTNSTTGLLPMLKNAATTNGDVYVSIVPFVKDVNVDPSNYSASWIYWDDVGHTDNTSWDAQNGTCTGASASNRNSCVSQGSCSIYAYNTQSSCQAATGSCSNPEQTSQTACTGQSACSIWGYTSQNWCTANKGCSKPQYTSKNSCTNNGGSWGNGVWGLGTWQTAAGVWTPATWTPNNHNTWNGCVMDRGSPTAPGTAAGNDENVTAPNTNDTTTLYPAEQYSMCPTAAVMGLSYDWTSMTNLVSSMTANGNTNQALGLQLGWMSLTGGGPFTVPAMDPNYTYQQYIIILTDGLNTQDRWYNTSANCGQGSTALVESPLMCMDQREAQLCDNIKASGITIYAIQVDTDGEPQSALLQYCAGNKAKQGTASDYWLLTSPTQITATFNTIGQQISKLHIAR